MKHRPPVAVALGVGCDRAASRDTLQQALNGALLAVGLVLPQVVAVASIDLKADEPGLLALAEMHGWPLHFYAPEQLARVAVPHPSETVRRHTGSPSVSEAAALLEAARVLGHSRPLTMAALLVEKFKHRGADGRNATVSIALCDPVFLTLQEPA